jgi:hypothetical protein
MTRVRIDFERVQSWLFAVPRLRAMVGANTLLGEVLRICLPNLARKETDWTLAPVAEGYPEAFDDDPLRDHDDPAADAHLGIVSRDGGHFEARFKTGPEAFVQGATALLRRELPSLKFSVRVDDLGQRDGNTQPSKKVSAHLSTELPVLAPCQWTGRGVGSVTINQGPERPWVSLDVKKRHDAADRAEKSKAMDLASLLVATTKLRDLKRPKEFSELVGDGYMALIHADGNDVGRGECMEEIRRAQFFHHNRVMLRLAARAAIEAACADGETRAPLVPLMLGGDDLLIVCRADVALPFVVKLCATLAENQRATPAESRLTLGVGVVIARHTIPINRLHDVAEGLAASAKRQIRGVAVEDKRSVVDWAVYTTTWMDDPEAVRRRDWVRGEGDDRRVLSRRPLDVVGCGLSTLQALLCAAEKLKDAPRSQLRYLVDQLPKGRMLSELAFAELSKPTLGKLREAGLDQIWQPTPEGPLVTRVLDLIEILEIGRLGRASADRSATGDDVAGAETPLG